MSYVIQSRGANPGTPNIELQQSHISALVEKSQLKQQLQTLLLTLSRLEVSPRQRNDKYLAMVAVTMILENQQ